MKELEELMKGAGIKDIIIESSSSSFYNYIFVRETKLLYKRNWNCIMWAMTFYSEFYKKAFILLSYFIRIPGNRAMFLKIESSKGYDLIKGGKSSRLKYFDLEGKVVGNRLYKLGDGLLEHDKMIRNKIALLGIAPQIVNSYKEGYDEELIIFDQNYSVKKDLKELLSIKQKFSDFFNSELKFSIKYWTELASQLRKRDVLIPIPKALTDFSLEIVMSHGDFWKGNILKTKELFFLIDYEFSDYRSSYYDVFYLSEKEGLDTEVLQSKNILPNHNFYVYKAIYLMERLILILRLHRMSLGNYEGTIESLKEGLFNAIEKINRKN